MPPKTEKRKSVVEEVAVNINDAVNTDDWRCVVLLAAARTPADVLLSQMFVDAANASARREVKAIDFETDVMMIVKQFASGEINYRFAFLLNFSAVYEEAADYLRRSEKIPVKLIVKLVKTLLFLLRKEDIETRRREIEWTKDPIEIMASKPKYPPSREGGSDKGGKRESRAGGDRKKTGKASDARSITSSAIVKVKPPTPKKEDTKLLRRGERLKSETIDDAPANSYYHMYIALTGFRDPDLTLQLVKIGVPIHCVLCLDSSAAAEMNPLLAKSKHLDQQPHFDKYWTDFLRLLWKPHLTMYFADVVFQVYSPKELPSTLKELTTHIYNEICFLMYDLSDLKRQLGHYLRHMRVWSVSEPAEKVLPDPEFASDLNRLSRECVSIPMIMRFILDSICGEDCPDEELVRDVEPALATDTVNTPISFEQVTGELGSYTSLLPFQSTVRLPTPRWSTIVDTAEKHVIYAKMLALEDEYGIGEYESSRLDGMSYADEVCVAVKRHRLPCANLDSAIQDVSGGLLSRLWRNYPIQKEEVNVDSRKLKLTYPEVMTNYVLYVLWTSRLSESRKMEAALEEIEEIQSLNSQTNFTVTDGSRIVLQKTSRELAGRAFFSPSQLKIIAPSTLESLSAPQLRPPPKFSWTDKSFVSEDHIPLKYLTGTPLTTFDDLRNYLGEDALSHMADYDFIEELDRTNMIRRIEDSAPNYDSIRHAYSPLTDSIYIVMYNMPTVDGVQREVYNVMLTTPVALRDFFDYILDDEREWIRQQKPIVDACGDTTRLPDRTIAMYNPTPDFREFKEFDFWHENSIKYNTRTDRILASAIYSSDSSVQRSTTGSAGKPSQKWQSDTGESYRFVGFDFGVPGAVQYSGVDTKFIGREFCTVRVSLQERLYGNQQLGVHVQQGGHVLHLYSYVCPRPHVDQPYTCHVEYKNGTIVAFGRRSLETSEQTLPTRRDTIDSVYRTSVVDDPFAYDMKLSLPNGLKIETVRRHVSPCYIQQMYPAGDREEKRRLFLPNGNVVKMMMDGTVQVFASDTSFVVASLEDIVLDGSPEEVYGEDDTSSKWIFRSFQKTTMDGYRYTVLDRSVVTVERYHIMRNSDMECHSKYFHRMDSTYSAMLSDGTTVVEFPDGTKITCYLSELDMYEHGDFPYGEDAADDLYVMIHMQIVMEHPDYVTAIYDTRRCGWRILLPESSEVEIDGRGCHHVKIDRQTELDVSREAIRMWRYGPRDEFVTSTTADLTVFGRDAKSTIYCTTLDSSRRKFIVEANANCYVTEECVEERSSLCEDDTDDTTGLRRYFVVRRDLTGFEIVHTKWMKRELDLAGPDVITHSEVVDGCRYFAFVKPKPEIGGDLVERTTPSARFKSNVVRKKNPSTYGTPPTWIQPFPKAKFRIDASAQLEGRVMLEIKPTDCPNPNVADKRFAFCDETQIPEPTTSLTESVSDIVHHVAHQDQTTLRDIYYAGIRRRVEHNKHPPSGGDYLEQYLKMSEHHLKLRETLKRAVLDRSIPLYFDYPFGMAWVILDGIISSVVRDEGEPVGKLSTETSRTETSRGTSEIEYNLDFLSERSYSDLSRRSNLSMKTAPATLGMVPVFPILPPAPRIVKSEPAYKPEDVKKSDDNTSYTYGFRYTPPPSAVCVFTQEDFLTLEETNPPRENEPEKPRYNMEDLMTLGLV